MSILAKIFDKIFPWADGHSPSPAQPIPNQPSPTQPTPAQNNSSATA